MAILGLATSAADGRIGLHLPDGTVRTAPPLGRATRGRDLLPAVRDLLGQHGLAPADLTGIVADRGPGSFTGVRVGVTCAKTLAFALGIPVAGVLSLDALAHAATSPGPVTAVRDAGRGTLYVAAYGPSAERVVLRPPSRQPATSLREQTDTTFVGEDAVALARTHELGPAEDVVSTLDTLFRLGMPALASAPPAHALAPCYLQASAPERLRKGEI